MAKFFNSMASSITSAFNKNIDPNQVREVAATQYAVQPVRRREDCLLLYCPAPTADGKTGPAGEGAMVFTSQGGDSRRASVTMETGPPFEVVVQSERNVNYCYSLFRTRDISEAEARYITSSASAKANLSPWSGLRPTSRLCLHFCLSNQNWLPPVTFKRLSTRCSAHTMICSTISLFNSLFKGERMPKLLAMPLGSAVGHARDASHPHLLLHHQRCRL